MALPDAGGCRRRLRAHRGASSFSIPGTEAQKAFDLLEQRFPGMSADGATARVVFKAPTGEKMGDKTHKATVEKTVKALGDGSEVTSGVRPLQVPRGEQGRVGRLHLGQVQGVRHGVEGLLEDRPGGGRAQARDAGLSVEVGGDALQATPETGSTEVIGIAVAAVVLVITFGSLIAAGLPLLTALIGVGIGVSTITALANALDLGHHHLHPGDDDRPRGRHRLRPVHRLPLPGRTGRGPGSARRWLDGPSARRVRRSSSPV